MTGEGFGGEWSAERRGTVAGQIGYVKLETGFQESSHGCHLVGRPEGAMEQQQMGEGHDEKLVG
jgi:hypothetical protein